MLNYMLHTEINEKVRKSFKYGLENVQYYKNYNFTSEIEKYENILKIPALLKDDLRNNWDKFIADKYKEEELIIDFTSGSTGKPLKIGRTESEINYERKSLWKQRMKWLPNSLSAKRAEFGRNTRYFLKNLNEYVLIKDNVLYVKGMLSQELCIKYIEALEEFQPEWILGSPSFLLQFITFSKNHRRINIQPKFIETTGEFLYDHVKSEIESYFKCPVVNHYGARELWPLAYQCKEGQFHVNERDAFIEIVSNPNIDFDDGYGELIITSLNIHSMPILRYKLGDIGRLRKLQCSCGSSSPILELLGARSTEYAITRNGMKIGAFFFSTIFVDQILRSGYRGILSWQVIQNDTENFNIFLVINDFYDSICEQIISKNITNSFGDVNIKFNYIEKIPVHLSGKAMYFINDIDNN